MPAPLHTRIERRARFAAVVPAAIPLAQDPPDHASEAALLAAACTAAVGASVRRRPAEWVWMHERGKRRPRGASAEAPQAKAVPKSAALSSD